MAAVDTNSPELGRNTSVNTFGSQAAQHSTAQHKQRGGDAAAPRLGDYVEQKLCQGEARVLPCLAKGAGSAEPHTERRA